MVDEKISKINLQNKERVCLCIFVNKKIVTPRHGGHISVAIYLGSFCWSCDSLFAAPCALGVGRCFLVHGSSAAESK